MTGRAELRMRAAKGLACWATRSFAALRMTGRGALGMTGRGALRMRAAKGLACWATRSFAALGMTGRGALRMTASDQELAHAEIPGVMTGRAALGMTGGTPLKFAHGKLISECLWHESY